MAAAAGPAHGVQGAAAGVGQVCSAGQKKLKLSKKI